MSVFSCGICVARSFSDAVNAGLQVRKRRATRHGKKMTGYKAPSESAGLQVTRLDNTPKPACQHLVQQLFDLLGNHRPDGFGEHADTGEDSGVDYQALVLPVNQTFNARC